MIGRGRELWTNSHLSTHNMHNKPASLYDMQSHNPRFYLLPEAVFQIGAHNLRLDFRDTMLIIWPHCHVATQVSKSTPISLQPSTEQQENNGQAPTSPARWRPR